ncbi:molybdopterin-dependent oxidoreductase [Roseovarius aquimarinus]|uniref:Molybdopterin-dependent oxidoreductase n=1 Tax=Roseovarius aquimarinus TaxID=1229156 RepID=A0ABW7I5H6_9RHOB
MNRRSLLSCAAAALLSFAPMAHAEDGVILTINDGYTGTTTTFTEEELAALPQQSFETTTVWTEGETSFSGPSLSDVLDAAGVAEAASGLRVYAINDYNVLFPAENIEEDAPILARRINGEPFSVRDKGPLWLIFPFDLDTRYQSEDIFALSVWQLTQIDVLTD